MFFDWREVGVASKPLAYAFIATAIVLALFSAFVSAHPI